jgi:cell division protein FtsA
MVVDIGGGTTDAAIFRDGSLLHTYILPVGGNQISNDLAFALRATFPVAEELKIRSGTTISHAPSNGDVIAVPAHGRDEPQPIEQRLVAEIIDARLAETFELVREQMMQAGFGDAYPGGVVLTGGSAQIPGTAALASEIFGTPARIGVPQRLRGLADAVRGPAFSTSVGILLWGQTQLTSASEPHGSKGLSALGASLKAWVQNFFG